MACCMGTLGDGSALKSRLLALFRVLALLLVPAGVSVFVRCSRNAVYCALAEAGSDWVG